MAAATQFSKQAALDSLQKANKLLLQQEWQKASQTLNNLLESNYQSEALYQNLALAQFNNQQYYEARKYVEEGLQLFPYSQKLLELQQLIKDEIGDFYQFPKYPLDDFFQSIHAYLGSNTLSFILLFLSLAGFTSMIIIRHKGNRVKKSVWIPILSGVSILTLLVVFEMRAKLRQDAFQFVTKEKSLHIAPDEISETILVLKEGHKFKKIDQLGDWLKIELADGNEGWIKAVQPGG